MAETRMVAVTAATTAAVAVVKEVCKQEGARYSEEDSSLKVR